MPRCRGGRLIIVVCRSCNRNKADIPLEAWLARLHSRADPRADLVAGWMKANPMLMSAVRNHETVPTRWDRTGMGHAGAAA